MKKLSNSEALIMALIWDHKEALTSAEIQRLLRLKHPEIQWEPTTVTTFLSRMVEKGIVSYEHHGKAYYYYPLLDRGEYKKELLRLQLMKKMSMTIEELFVTFAGEPMTDENLAKMKDYLNSK